MIKARSFWCLLVLLMAIANAGAQLATDCTLYASPAGGGSGASAGSPATINGANSASGPGDVICLEGGTYTFGGLQPQSGTAGSPIKWKPYGDSAVKIVWAGSNTKMFNMSGQTYIDFVGPWEIDGKEIATGAFGGTTGAGHHISISYMTIRNTIKSGISFVGYDYITAHHNVMSHLGENPNGFSNAGWSSAISINSPVTFGSYSGIHNFIYDNILVGEFDSSSNHTDGNGIILDLDNGGGTYPPTLIMNNVIYGTGGRCIETNTASQQNIFIINNTCYKNALDLTTVNPFGEIVIGSTNTYVVNNISYAWSGRNDQLRNYQIISSGNAQWIGDTWIGGAGNDVSSSYLMNVDPQFNNPPVCDSTAGHQYDNTTSLGAQCALDPGTGFPPASLGNRLQLQSGSPLLSLGIDPRNISGIPAQIVSDLQNYIYADINGNPRAVGNWALGAYQSSSSSNALSPPSGLKATVQ